MDQNRWGKLPLKDQIGHITSELGRAIVWEKRAEFSSRDKALERALELTEMTLDLMRGARRREIARLREAVAHCLVRSENYSISLKDLEAFGLRHFGG